MKDSTKQFLNFFIKIVIFAGLSWQIYAQIFYHRNFEQIKNEFLSNFNRPEFYSLLILVVLLMFFNWALETVKWKWLIDRVEFLPFIEAYKAIFCGVAFSLFTPNRVGEYGGRIFYLHNKNKLTGAIVTLVGSFCQVVVIIILGAFAFDMYMFKFKNWGSYLEWVIVFSSVFLCLMVLLAYFDISIVYFWFRWLYKFFRRFKWMEKIKSGVKSFSDYSFRDLVFLLLISFSRYAVFTFQYWVLLKMFGVDIPLFLGIVLIILIFFVQMIVPTFAIAELGVRGNIALFFLKDFSPNEIGIISAAFALWFINLILPSIIGGLLVFRINFLSDKK